MSLSGREHVADAQSETAPHSTSERLEQIIAAAPGESITLGALLDQLNERAYGVFLLVLALPCCIPFLYVVPQIVAVPMLFVAAQMALGRNAPWLPARFRERPIEIARLARVSARAKPYLLYLERLSRPRFSALTRPPLDQIVGLFLLVFCASILTPLPSTNTVPGIAVAITALGLLERDGLLVTGGLVLGTLWVGALLFAGATIVSLILG